MYMTNQNTRINKQLRRLAAVLLGLSVLALAAVPSCVSESGPSAGDVSPKSLQMCDLLGDHAVLQRSEATHVWGRGTPGAKVKVLAIEGVKLIVEPLAPPTEA